MAVYDELIKKVNDIQTNDTSNFVKKADHNTKIEEIERKFLIIMNTLILVILINLTCTI